jgi:hypothetical protein
MNREQRDYRRSIGDVVIDNEPLTMEEVERSSRREGDRMGILFAHMLKIENRLISHIVDHRLIVEETMSAWFRSDEYQALENTNREKLKQAVMAGIGQWLLNNSGKIISMALSLITGALMLVGLVMWAMLKHLGWVNLP